MNDFFLKAPLLFGNDSSQVFTDPDHLASAVKDHITHFTTETPQNFLYNYSEIKVNDLVVTSELLTHANIGAVVNSHSLLLALEGYYELEYSKNRFKTGNDVGLMIPPIEEIPLSTSKTGLTRGLLVNFDYRELNRVSNIMVGKPIQDMGLRQLPLQSKQANFLHLLLSWVSQIEGFNSNAHFLKQHGFDDQYYRLLAMILQPELFTANKPARKSRDATSANFVKLVEEYVAINLEQPINITNLQQYTSLSARGLQYAAQKYFGCSPRQYLYNKKLDRALELLKNNAAELSILEISERLGFSSQSRFSMFFAKRFGCKPSEVAQRRIIGYCKR